MPKQQADKEINAGRPDGQAELVVADAPVVPFENPAPLPPIPPEEDFITGLTEPFAPEMVKMVCPHDKKVYECYDWMVKYYEGIGWVQAE